MDAAFWRNRSVLITGHTGFKGSWLSLWLNRLGADVVGYSLEPPTTPNLFDLAAVAKEIQSLEGDVRDSKSLTAVVRDCAPEVIFHLAAQSVVLKSYDDPIDTYSTNVLGTACLLEAVRTSTGIKSVINVTTDKCYRNREWIWGYRETDELGGRDPYSSSKACSELVTQAFRDSYFPSSQLGAHGVAVATARGGNVIGGGDWTPDQLLPDVVRAFTKGKPVQIRQPNSVRPWQHVLDCLSGYIMLAEKLQASRDSEYSAAWNFGPPLTEARSVSWIADYLVRAWGSGAQWSADRSGHPHESRMLRLDSSKAIELLGWRSRLDLSQALDWTVEWYKSHHAGASAKELTLHQIDEYMNLP